VLHRQERRWPARKEGVAPGGGASGGGGEVPPPRGRGGGGERVRGGLLLRGEAEVQQLSGCCRCSRRRLGRRWGEATVERRRLGLGRGGGGGVYIGLGEESRKEGEGELWEGDHGRENRKERER